MGNMCKQVVNVGSYLDRSQYKEEEM